MHVASVALVARHSASATTSMRSTNDQWPPLTCHHSHSPHEWTPYLQDGRTVYPSKEEAEYTAVLAFAIAVAASWWAGRVGRAKLHVPRLPQFECVGAREHWLDLDPRALREWAMAPLALGLGLYPPDPREAARIPRRAQVDDVILEKGKLPPNHVYVGQGRGSHRLAKTKWASPVIPGLNSQSNDWLWHYVAHLYTSNLVGDLHELYGKVLVCDCPFCDPCEADVLAGLCFEAGHPSGRQTMHRFSRGGTPTARQVIATGLIRTVQGIPAIPTRWWSQESLTLASCTQPTSSRTSGSLWSRTSSMRIPCLVARPALCRGWAAGPPLGRCSCPSDSPRC